MLDKASLFLSYGLEGMVHDPINGKLLVKQIGFRTTLRCLSYLLNTNRSHLARGSCLTKTILEVFTGSDNLNAQLRFLHAKLDGIFEVFAEDQVQVTISLPRVFTGSKTFWMSRPFLIRDHWWSVKVLLTNSDLQLYSVSLVYFKLKNAASISLASLKSMLRLEPNSGGEQSVDVGTDESDYFSVSDLLSSYSHQSPSTIKPANRTALSLLDKIALPEVMPMRVSLAGSTAPQSSNFVIAREGESHFIGSTQLSASESKYTLGLTINTNSLSTKMTTDLFYLIAGRLKKHKTGDVSDLAWLPLSDFLVLLKVYRIVHGNIEQEIALLLAEWSKLQSSSQSQPRSIL